ncbi:MAG: hypothetical protein HYY34_01385 [Chloroflexi bacterium]|nr:hypothetical protein [Chloroflexota bacterium]
MAQEAPAAVTSFRRSDITRSIDIAGEFTAPSLLFHVAVPSAVPPAVPAFRETPISRHFTIGKALAFLLVLVVFASAAQACSRQPEPTPAFPAIPPAWPFVFNGRATVGDQPVPAGMLITGRIAEYRSAPVTTREGRYSALPVGPLDKKFFDRPIAFELTRSSDGRTVVAEQTLVFRALPQPSVYELDLTFPALD